MGIHRRVDALALPEDLTNVEEVLPVYYDIEPGPGIIDQRVSFGTSGHRGSSLGGRSNGAYIVAITVAIVKYRASQGIDGPLFIGRNTHALSKPAWRAALEVLAATEVSMKIDSHSSCAPTPTVSVAILGTNGAPQTLWTSGPGLADGTVVTPSRNPPHDGGFRYNPPHSRPAGTDATGWIANHANEVLGEGWHEVPHIIGAPLFEDEHLKKSNYFTYYVDQLDQIIDINAIRETGARVGADSLGGASVDYWMAIAERYGLELTVMSPVVNPAWPFMILDWDDRIHMDCSSPSAMASLRRAMTPDEDDNTPYDVATDNDADSDRRGVVTPDGLTNPNHYLAVMIDYLLQHRPGWRDDTAIGKTLVSSVLIDRVVTSMGRKLIEVPVGFKYFVPGLLDGSVGFDGEEPAGVFFLRKDGTVWSTDKDSIILALLTSEILAVTGKTPLRLRAELVERFDASAYACIGAPANHEQRTKLAALSPEDMAATELAGEPITARLVRAPGNDAAIGGLEVATENTWFAARPLSTEDVYKIYTESFRGAEHLAEVQEETKKVVSDALG